MLQPPQADFCIEIDYEKGTGSPSRVFRAMSDMIDAFQAMDRTLIRSIDSKIEPVLLLEDIEVSSLRAWVTQTLMAVEDDALKNIDWKPLIGRYLVKAKYIVIDVLNEETHVVTPQQIERIQARLSKLAQDTNVKSFPYYEPPSRKAIVQDIKVINDALQPLSEGDKAKFISGEGEANFNMSLEMAPESVDALITSESYTSAIPMILKVKRPDFLGDAMWDFHYDGRTISVKVADREWLQDFQSGQVVVTPGDALRAMVETEVKYDFDKDVIGTDYKILKVMEVIHKVVTTQSTFRQIDLN